MFPPRPKHRIRPVELPEYENEGDWVAQRKFNGTRTLIHVTEKFEVEAFRPGREPHLQWRISEDIKNQVRSLNIERGKEYWFDGELLNNKTETSEYKDKIVLWDILQAGAYFFNSPDLLGRYKKLQTICGNPKEYEPHNKIALKVTQNIWLAETFHEDFENRYKEIIQLDEIEGLVLKRANSKLKNWGTKKYEVSWQLRCRKEHKNYSF
jgi:ATP-dependent DNA ligase